MPHDAGNTLPGALPHAPLKTKLDTFVYARACTIKIRNIGNQY
jgi:hypothetical protein